MKKIAALLLILSLLLLVSCGGQLPDDGGVTPDGTQTPGGNDGTGDNNNGDGDNNQNPDNQPEEPGVEEPGVEEPGAQEPVDPSPYVPFSFAEGEINTVIFTDLQNSVTLNLSYCTTLLSGLKSLRYNPEQEASISTEILYELVIDGKKLDVYDGNVVAFDGSATYLCQGFEISTYLSCVYVGVETFLVSSDTTTTIVVKNNKGLTASITDSAELVSALSQVVIIALSNPSDYTLPGVDYTITLADEVVKICGGYIAIGDNLYAIIEGDFTILSTYKYSSTSGGFLPYV